MREQERDFDDSLSLKEALEAIAEALKDEGFETPNLDAQLILAHVIDREKSYILAHPERILTENEILQINDAVTERLYHRPVAYITGKKEFYKSSFIVDERVLIPRGDTEILVEEALAEIKALKKAIKILDLGCGSGAIGLSVALESPNCSICLSDISEEALEVARMNARALGLEERVRIIPSDLFDSFLGEEFDMILTNPPYISSDGMNILPPTIARWEPFGALYGGEDGLAYYRMILEEAPRYLKGGGMLLAEIGEDQGQAVTDIAERNGFEILRIVKDLSLLDRVLVARVIK